MFNIISGIEIILNQLYLLQIRQEKPYYIADPEVDSLVSIKYVELSQFTL